jgi:hypothetical protein
MELDKKDLNRRFAYDRTTGVVTRKISVGNRKDRKAGTVIGTKARHTLTIGLTLEGRKRVFPLGRVIWTMVLGPIPKKHVIDHINGNPFDNRLANLRAVATKINGRNLSLKKTNKSGVNGVYWRNDKKRWAAEMMVDGRKHWLGHFLTREAANTARLAAQEAFGFHENHGKRRTVVRRHVKIGMDITRGGQPCPTNTILPV